MSSIATVRFIRQSGRCTIAFVAASFAQPRAIGTISSIRIQRARAMSTANHKDLAGKLALVTGGARGIGAAISENLAGRGANLIIHYNSDKSADMAKELTQKLQSGNDISIFRIKADISSTTGGQEIIDAAIKQWDETSKGQQPFRLDIIVNNAGVVASKPIEKCGADDFAFQYNVNVRGPLLLLKAALPHLPRDRSGRIVNISSVSSSLGFIGQSVYGGTKAALEAMTRTWSRELADRATVNAVNPGPVETDMYSGISDAFAQRMKPFLLNTPLAAAKEGLDEQELVELAAKTGGRVAKTSEVASLVGLLCSPSAGFTTGSVLNANGGMYFSF